MSFSVNNQPQYLLGSDSAPVVGNTVGSWVTIPGNQVYRNIMMEGVPNGCSVAVNVRNSNRPSNVMVVTGPAGTGLVMTIAEMLTAVQLPGAPMQLQAVLTGAGGSTSIRVYLV